MQIDLYQVDAFTDKVFGGNPAAVCPLSKWLPDETLLNIAAENNLSETAFFVPSNQDGIDYHLKWFTPTIEVDLCGHATLASSYVIFNHLDFEKETIRFESKSGILEVSKTKTGYTLNFPTWTPDSCAYSAEDIEKILGVPVIETHQSTKTFAILNDAKTVQDLKPDFGKVKTLEDTKGLVITAKGENGVDFVSRLFAPQIGIDEDPVTGAIHCFLIPYWAKKLNKNKMLAHQLSKRRGELHCEIKGGRVEISGNAVLYMKGTINI